MKLEKVLDITYLNSKPSALEFGKGKTQKQKLQFLAMNTKYNK